MLFRLAVGISAIVILRALSDLRQPKCVPKYGCRNRNIIVTGANSGIGYQTAKYLYEEGANVIMACRNEEKAKKAIEKIKRQCSGNKNVGSLMFIKLDLNNFRSIHEFVNVIYEKNLEIFSLVNNAGVHLEDFKVNEYGFEETFMTNHLGHQLLSDLLLPRLIEAGTKLSPSKIVYVNSTLYRNGIINDDYFESSKMTEKEFKETSMYVNSKLAQVLYARELAENVARANYPLYVNIASPGFVATNLGGKLNSKKIFQFLFMSPLLLFILRTPKQGCQTIVHCVLSNNLSTNGKWFRKCKEGPFFKIADDQSLIKKVYKLTRDAIGIIEK